MLALLPGDGGRDQAVFCKDVAAPSVSGHLQERKSLRALINAVGISGGSETPQSPCSSETGGISDRNEACHCPGARQAQLRGEALSRLDHASLSKEPCSLQGLEDAGICSLCLIQKSLVLGKAFWARCLIRHLFYRVFRTGLSSGFPELGKAGKWFPAVAG